MDMHVLEDMPDQDRLNQEPQGTPAGLVEREARKLAPLRPTTPFHHQRRGLVVLVALLVLALMGVGAFYGVLEFTAFATVTITPASSDVAQIFTLIGVTGTPDAAQQQVRDRPVSVTTPAQTLTVNATGQKTTPGTHARGTLYVENDDTANSLTLSAGTTFPNNAGGGTGSVCALPSLEMVLDRTVSLPPASGNPSHTRGVPGHIFQVGASGNFPSSCGQTVSFGYTPNSRLFYLINDSAFTGGTDPQTATVVTQSDIDGATQTLIQINQPDPQLELQGQLQQGEQLADTPHCSPHTSADHQVGDAATQVTVTVSFTCTGIAYDQAGALVLVASLLKDQAASTPGAGYALVGQLKTTLLSATSDAQGTVQIEVQAEGVWAYQFSVAQKQALAKLIAGKSKQEAQRLLASQPGVETASITLSGGNSSTLPTDLAKIKINVQTVSGWQGR